jgi:zinc protease
MNFKKQLFETIFSHVFKNRNENYSLPIIGTVDTLNNINSKALKEFFNTYYHYDNSVFVVVGNINYNTVSAYVKKLVNKYPRSGIKTKDIEFAHDSSEPTMILKQIANSTQTTMLISFYLKEITELQKIQLFLLNHILTGNFMSILFNELRVKKGLCYGVNSDSLLVKNNNKYSGVFFIKINSDQNKIKECLKLILLFIITRKINKTVYLNSKKSLDNTVSFSFQTSKDYLYFFGNMMLNEDKIMPSKIINILKKTTLKDINDLLHVIKKGDIFVNMMGNYQK